jgi:colanic acid/amylovoran biosynthesis glycosyltransferase
MIPSPLYSGERVRVRGRLANWRSDMDKRSPPSGPSPLPSPLSTGERERAAQLRIAYMTGEYPRATDTFIQREVAALRASGVHVQTFAIRRPHNKENVGPETEAERARTFYVFPPRPLKILGAHLKLLFTAPGRYFRAMKTALTVRSPGVKAFIWQLAYFAEAGVIAREVRRQKLSHLHNHFSNSSCSVAMLAAEMGGFTFSFTMHGPAEFFEPKYWRIDEKIRRALFVACISHFCRSQAMIFGPQEKWDRMHIVHCGVDPALFSPVRHEGIGRRLLFVGRLAGVKGLPMLLDAVALVKASHPEVKLTLAGDGPDRARLEEQARRLGIAANVEFLGYRSQAQVRELLQQTDVFVMGSFAEGVPVVLMEAMAAGVPVVATQIAGIPELVEPGVNGLLVPPGDVGSLAAAIERLVEDPSLRSTLGANGSAKVAAEFNIHREAARLGAVLTGALAGRVLPIRPELPSGVSTHSATSAVVAKEVA